jgi:hypothetical protein
VLAGTWLTGYHQRQQRRQTVIREQLEHFYSPMVALRKRIRAKSETREKIHSIADEVWREKVGRDLGPEQLRAMEETFEPEFDKLAKDDERRLREELLPAYRRMLDCFTEHMWLAEPSTREHFAALVAYLEIWDRALAESIPKGVGKRLDHREASLNPLYDDLERQFERLRLELKESTGWRLWRRCRPGGGSS